MSAENRDSDQLEREVDAARAQLGATVDAIGQQLSPGQLMDEFMSMTKTHGGDFAQSLGSQVKQNPLALLMTGIGATWLMAGSGAADAQTPSNFNGGQYDEGHSNSSMQNHAASAVNSLKDKTAAAGGATREKAQSAMDSAKAVTRNVKATGTATVNEVQSQLDSVLQDQPLVAGALGVALGAALGALIPPTEAEDHLLGVDADRVRSKAADVAEEKYDALRDKAKEKADEVEPTPKG